MRQSWEIVKKVAYMYDYMPFDRNGVHATGRVLLMGDGKVVYEWEDDLDFYDYSEAVEVEEEGEFYE